MKQDVAWDLKRTTKYQWRVIL